MARAVRPADEHGLRILLLPFTHVRHLDNLRRVILAGATTIAVCSLVAIPEFGWLEATQLLIAVACIRLLSHPIESQPFACPFHDGTLFAVAGMWTAIVTLINTLDGASTSTGIIVVAGCMALFVAGMLLRREEGDWFAGEAAPGRPSA